jgi:hypothetical protein
MSNTGYALAIAVPASGSFLAIVTVILWPILVRIRTKGLLKVWFHFSASSLNDLSSAGGADSVVSKGASLKKAGSQQLTDNRATSEGRIGEWAVFGLICADLVQSIGGQLSYTWLYNNIDASAVAGVCALQGLLIAFSNLSSALWNAFICLLTVHRILGFSQHKIDRQLLAGGILICTVLPAILMLSLFSEAIPGSPVYGDSGSGGW